MNPDNANKQQVEQPSAPLGGGHPEQRGDCHDMLVELDDLELLQQTVTPWKVEMRQLSAGKFHARERFAPVNTILVTLENWNQRMITQGCTPPDVLMIGGNFSARPLTFCDHQLDSRHLGIGIDASDVAFVTHANSLHWTVLIPLGLLEGRPGFDAMRKKARSHLLECSREQSERLRRLISTVLNQGVNSYSLPEEHPALVVMEYQILEAVADLLNEETGKAAEARRHAHWEHCLEAIDACGRLDHQASLPELTSATGLSKRVLQLSFKDVLGLSPYRYMQTVRLHQLHELLLFNSRESLSVTDAMVRCGFRELGRASGTYRDLFGERPSETLLRQIPDKPLQFAAAMHPAGTS